MKRPMSPGARPVLYTKAALAALMVGAFILVTQSSTPGDRTSRVSASQATPEAELPECSAWELTLRPDQQAGIEWDPEMSQDVQGVLEIRLYELIYYDDEHVVGGYYFPDDPGDRVESTQMIVQLLMRPGADTPERLLLYEGVFTDRGHVVIMDAQSALATPTDATPWASPVLNAPSSVTSPASSLRIDNGPIWNAYPEVDGSGDDVVTFEMADEVMPTLEAYLGEEPSRELAIILDGEIIAIVDLTSMDVESGRMSFPVSDEDQVGAWIIMIRSGEMLAGMESLGWRPVDADACA